jgi:hypothetical protein
MVMKRVEAGEDIFEDMHKHKNMSTNVDKCPKQLSPVAMNTQSSMEYHQILAKSLQAYDTMTQRDQGAVLILYQMAKAM